VSAAVVRIGTRRSPLALVQSQWVAARLSELGHRVELVPVVTRGDVSTEPLSQIGGTGVFVSAVRDALLDGRVDVAVHSLKDLPTAGAPGLSLASVPPRADPRDALVARDGLTLGGLPPGSRVGTGSPRRAAQLRAHRPDLQVVDVRGNVDTRLGLVADGVVDAVVLARAGLVRLGRVERITEVIDPSIMLPAPGQGALALEVRAPEGADRPLDESLRQLDDPASRAAVTAERAVLSGLEAGCSAPVGALAVTVEPGFAEPELSLQAVVASVDGKTIHRMSITAPLVEAVDAGHRLALQLLTSGDVVITGDVAR
jgi:hydroxymethylbilane synthase